MTNFWQDLPKPFFILAPMDEVTDVVFRHIMNQAGRPDIYFTEFTNSASYCSPAGKHSTEGRLMFEPDEQPIVAQIWGNQPEHFKQMSQGLAEQGFAGIDINFGCPVKDVVKQNCGIGIIKDPELAVQLIANAKSSGLPISVKTRLGYSSIDEWQAWLTLLLKQNIANLTIHLRTKKEMSKVPAHFELIPEILKLRDKIAPNTLITINGDIRDRQHGMELVEKYGVDGIMIGRGVFTNPFAFSPERSPTFEDSNRKDDLIELLLLHLDLHDQYSTPETPRKFQPLKRFFKMYLRDFPGASELRNELMQTKDTKEVREVLATFMSTQIGDLQTD